MNLLFRLKHSFTLARKLQFQISSSRLDILALNLDKDLGESCGLNSLEKYMVIKRKSVVTGGKIPELKGLQVQKLMENYKFQLISDMLQTKSINYSPQQLVNLLMLDYTIFQGNGAPLLKYLESVEMRKEQLLFLVKATLFSGRESKRGVKNNLTQNKGQSKEKLDSTSVIQLQLLQKVFANEKYFANSAFGLAYLFLIYYETLRVNNTLNDKENGIYFQNKQNLMFLEKKHRQLLGIEGIQEDKLYFEHVIDSLLQLNSVTNSEVIFFIEQLVYFGQFSDSPRLVQLYSKIDHQKLQNVHQLTHLINCATSKNVLVAPEIYQAFISCIQSQLKTETNQDINIQNQTPNTSNMIVNSVLSVDGLADFINGTDKKGLTFEEINLFDLNTKVECLWILARNYSLLREKELITNLLKSIEPQINRLQVKPLLSLLQTLIAVEMQNSILFIENKQSLSFSYTHLFHTIVRLLMSRISTSSKQLAPKQKCSLYLHLHFLLASGVIKKRFIDPQIFQDLEDCYNYLTLGKSQSSRTEQTFQRAFANLIRNKQINQTYFKTGQLINGLYYIDFLLSNDLIIEINGDLHHNKQTNSQFRHNYLLKLFYLKMQGYKVVVIHNEQYLPLIKDQGKLQDLIVNLLLQNNNDVKEKK